MNRIQVDLERTLNTIYQNVFGGYVEHPGRRICGGICAPQSPLADEAGFRLDVRQVLRRRQLLAGVTVTGTGVEK